MACYGGGGGGGGCVGVGGDSGDSGDGDASVDGGGAHALPVQALDGAAQVACSGLGSRPIGHTHPVP